MAKSRLSTVNFGGGNGGLATVGYTLYNTGGTTHQARTTSGVVEFGSSTGVYGAFVNLPSDKSVLILWDTGGGSPIYGSEDSNTQLDSIQEGTDINRLMWNSLKNQGSFFTTLMDKLGLIEKNQGLVKSNIENSIKGIKFPEQTPIKIPDFSEQFGGINVTLGDIFKKTSEIASNRETGFSNINAVLEQKINTLTEAVRNGNSETKSKIGVLIADLKSAQKAFSQVDSVVNKLSSFNEKFNQQASDKKAIADAEKEMLSEIKRLKTMLANTINMMANSIASLSGTPQRNSDLLLSFGGKK